MYKRKDGKVIASLTEVKNKTGDIFALVDEYGEVTLTSYNKPRYKISKIDIVDILEVKDRDETPKVRPTSSNVFDKVRSTVSSIAPRPRTSANGELELISEEVISALSGLEFWDRNDKAEKKFVVDALRPLQ